MDFIFFGLVASFGWLALILPAFTCWKSLRAITRGKATQFFGCLAVMAAGGYILRWVFAAHELGWLFVLVGLCYACLCASMAAKKQNKTFRQILAENPFL